MSLEAPTTITPTVIEFEHILDKIISLANLPFPVDRAWLKSKKETILYRKRQHISTYAALCPSPSHQHDDKTHRQHIDLLNHTLFQIINTDNLLVDSEPHAIINHCSFSLPHINHWDQSIQFLIKGIDPSIILVDKTVEEIFTQRELAANIFRAFKAMYRQVCFEKPLPDLISNIDEYDTTSITNFMSVRKKNFDEAKEPIFAVVISEHTDQGKALIDSMKELCSIRQSPIYIGGDITKIELIPPPPKSKQNQRDEFFKDIVIANTRLVPDRTKNNRPIALTQIRAPPTITQHPSLITLLANHKEIKGCEGVFINLRLGP